MIRLPPDFKEFLGLLNTHSVDYLLIGGYAVAHHGYPRATADIDVWIDVYPDNAKRLKDALMAFGFPSSSIDEKDFLVKGKMFRMGRPPLRLELLTEISGVAFEECFERKEVVEVEGISIPVISAKDLKANKKASGRPKDLNDLKHL